MTSAIGISQHQVQANDQGILNGRDGQIWPVLVLRNDIVPDSLRQTPPEGIIPVLLFHKNQIDYVSCSSVEKKTTDELIRMMGSASVDRVQDQALFTAFFLACEGRNPQYWLDKIREEHDASTRPEVRTVLEDATAKMSAPKTKRPREETESDCEQSESSSSSKRQRSENSKTASDDETLVITDEAVEVQEPAVTRYVKWPVEQDAELIRLRERDQPDAPWSYVLNEFQRRFATSARTPSSIRPRYLNYLRPDAAGKGHFDPDTCIKARVNALSLLDRLTMKYDKTADLNSDSDDRNEVIAMPTEERSTKIDNPGTENVHSTQTNSADMPEEIHGENGSSSNTQVHAPDDWDSHQDAELIRLYEREDTSSSNQVKVQFLQRFPNSNHSLRAIRRRYKHYLQSNAFAKHGKAGTQEECDELRAFALSILDSPFYNLGKSAEERDDLGGGWLGEEDALLIWLREECAEMSWDGSFQLFQQFHADAARTLDDIRDRYEDYLQPQASAGQQEVDNVIRDELRARALSLKDFISMPTDEDVAAAVEDSLNKFIRGVGHNAEVEKSSKLEFGVPEHPQLANASGRKWTAEEDAHLISLRENHKGNGSWSQLHSIWVNAFPLSPRTKDSLNHRYRDFLERGAIGPTCSSLGAKDCQELRDRALAFRMEYGENDSFLVAVSSSESKSPHPQKWTVEEDATLIQLREHFVQKGDWRMISKLFNQRLPKSARSDQAIKSRYGTYLALDATGNEWCSIAQCQQIRKRAEELRVSTGISDSAVAKGFCQTGVADHTGQTYTAAEDAEIIRLKEQVSFNLNWEAILQAFKQKFRGSARTIGSLRQRYSEVLKKSPAGRTNVSLDDCAQLRARALQYLEEQHEKEQIVHRIRPKRDAKVISLLSDDEEDQEVDNSEVDEDDSDSQMPGDGDDDDEEDSESDAEDSPETVRNEDAEMSGNSGDEEEDDEEPKFEDELEEELEGDALTFVIGQEQHQFRVPINRTLANSYILEDTVHDNNIGAVVTGSRWTRLKPEHFEPVYEFLKHGDYRPRLQGERLVGLSKSPNAHGREVVRCGQIFDLARELQLEVLMDLVCRKFKLLKKDPLAVLMAARLIYKVETTDTEHETTMRELLIDEVARNYETYISERGEMFVKQHKKNLQFGMEVMERYLATMKKKAAQEWEIV